MVSSDRALDPSAPLTTKHAEICAKLNLDEKTTTESWVNYVKANRSFTLEGEPLHWVAFSIYGSNWKPPSNQIQGTSLNFISLLRYSNMSLTQFFMNIRKWGDMANLPEEFHRSIDRFERTYTASYNSFKRLQTLFPKIFKPVEVPDSDQFKQHRNRKQKTSPCTSTRVFEFSWVLFITIKGQDPKYSTDFVKSCNLLLSICDWTFKNAFLACRKDLLNPDFPALPEEWSAPSFTPVEAPCIIELLCGKFESVTTDIKYMKEYDFKQSLKNLFDKNILNGNSDNYCDVFEPMVFERNYKNLSNSYENNVVSKGEFDERIFLAEHKRRLLARSLNNQENSGDNSTLDSPRVDKDQIERVYKKLVKISSYLSGCTSAPSDSLVELFESCSNNPTDKIDAILKQMTDKFISLNQDDPETAHKRSQVAISLFYKLIEGILQNEKSIQSDITAIVDKEVFYQCIYACCLEVVLDCFNNPKKFPWILDVMEIAAYNFVKVIELIVRCKDHLPRDIIKHLNTIEEECISSLVWKGDSPIWEAIEASGLPIPKFEEIALPSHLRGSVLPTQDQVQSSPGPSATDRFQSPVNRQQLFTTSSLNQTHLVVQDKNGVTKVIPLMNSQPQTPTPNRPKRSGGLAIIMRKFFNLAGERMDQLCSCVEIKSNLINDGAVKSKIFTVFEECIRKNNCELIRDRHMDQILMCAVYIICRLNNPNYANWFESIMKAYRHQPQATSEIYREVLLKSKTTRLEDGIVVEVPEERCHLIKFYNTIMFSAMKKFAGNFTNNGEDNASPKIQLSPLPACKKQLISPRVQLRGNLFINPFEASPTMTASNGSRVYNYIFSRSPSRDLRDINKAIKTNGVTGKRLCVEGEIEMPPSKRLQQRKVQSLIEERKNQNAE